MKINRNFNNRTLKDTATGSRKFLACVILKRILKILYNKILFIIVILCIIVFPPIVKYILSFSENQKISITIKKYKLIVEIADTKLTRTTGLMFRKELEWDNGMLFVFEAEKKVSFWMKNTSIPLSIAFIDRNGIITEILDLKPNNLTSKKSKKKVKYALEVNRDYFRKNDIKAGDKIEGLNYK